MANLKFQTLENMKASFERMKYGNDFLREAKKQYGLVPIDGESLKDFQTRVYDTVFDKTDISKNDMVKSMLKSGANNTTQEVKDIINKYLGFTNVPLDAFEKTKKSKHAAGFTLPDIDGSAIISTNDMPDNTDVLISTLANDLEDIINGRKVKRETPISDLSSVKGKLTKSLELKGYFDNSDDAHRMYLNFYDNLLENETNIKLHEGIHAVHIANMDWGRKNGFKNKMFKTFSYVSLLPIVGPVITHQIKKLSVKTEAFAYKIGLDLYSMDILDKAIDMMPSKNNLNEKQIAIIKQEFKDMNTHFTKSIINEGYIQSALRGYSTPEKNYTKSLLYGMYGFGFYNNESVMLGTLGTLMLVAGANALVKIPFSMYAHNLNDKFVDTVDGLCNKYGAKETFDMCLGKSFKDMKKML